VEEAPPARAHRRRSALRARGRRHLARQRRGAQGRARTRPLGRTRLPTDRGRLANDADEEEGRQRDTGARHLVGRQAAKQRGRHQPQSLRFSSSSDRRPTELSQKGGTASRADLTFMRRLGTPRSGDEGRARRRPAPELPEREGGRAGGKRPLGAHRRPGGRRRRSSRSCASRSVPRVAAPPLVRTCSPRRHAVRPRKGCMRDADAHVPGRVGSGWGRDPRGWARHLGRGVSLDQDEDSDPAGIRILPTTSSSSDVGTGGRADPIVGYAAPTQTVAFSDAALDLTLRPAIGHDKQSIGPAITYLLDRSDRPEVRRQHTVR
jgi:hypothetical protein